MINKFIPKITVFHCIHTFADESVLSINDTNEFRLKTIKLPCSSMVKDIFLLRAFEAGADMVAVMVCPEGACRYVEGNVRAKKRIAWVKKLLDDIGLNGRRLSLFHINSGDTTDVIRLIQSFLSENADLGPNPAA